MEKTDNKENNYYIKNKEYQEYKSLFGMQPEKDEKPPRTQPDKNAKGIDKASLWYCIITVTAFLAACLIMGHLSWIYETFLSNVFAKIVDSEFIDLIKTAIAASRLKAGTAEEQMLTTKVADTILLGMCAMLQHAFINRGVKLFVNKKNFLSKVLYVIGSFFLMMLLSISWTAPVTFFSEARNLVVALILSGILFGLGYSAYCMFFKGETDFGFIDRAVNMAILPTFFNALLYMGVTLLGIVIVGCIFIIADGFMKYSQTGEFVRKAVFTVIVLVYNLLLSDKLTDASGKSARGAVKKFSKKSKKADIDLMDSNPSIMFHAVFSSGCIVYCIVRYLMQT